MAITWAGTAWVATTSYALRARVVNDGTAYQCIAAGISAGSGGPTGTAADITDGTVHWTYLGAHTGSVVDVAPELSTTPAAAQATLIALAETIIADPVLWGDLFDDARRYLAAHFGQYAKLRGKGQITNETVGPLSRGYAQLMGPLAWDLTAGGRMYAALVRLTEGPLGAVP